MRFTNAVTLGKCQRAVTIPTATILRAVNQRAIRTRFFSSVKNNETPGEQSKAENNSVMNIDYDDYDDYEEPKTAKDKVRVYTIVLARLAFLFAGVACIYVTAKELFPGRMNPNSIFSDVFDMLQYNEEIMVVVGEGMKAYGRDVGRNTEGRRNHIDSYKYKAEDGTDRIRTRFNIKGAKGKVMVWAEVSSGMADNQYVYIVCQDMRNGRVITIVDNRDQLEAELLNNEDPSANLISKFFSSVGGNTAAK